MAGRDGGGAAVEQRDAARCCDRAGTLTHRGTTLSTHSHFFLRGVPANRALGAVHVESAYVNAISASTSCSHSVEKRRGGCLAQDCSAVVFVRQTIVIHSGMCLEQCPDRASTDSDKDGGHSVRKGSRGSTPWPGVEKGNILLFVQTASAFNQSINH